MGYGLFRLNTHTLLTYYLPQAPIILVYVVGLIMAVKRWDRHPRVSLLTAIALGLLFAATLVGNLIDYLLLCWATGIRHHQWWPPVDVTLIPNIARTVLSVVSWGLLLIALFGWRYAPQPITKEDTLEEPRTGGESPDATVREGRSH